MVLGPASFALDQTYRCGSQRRRNNPNGALLPASVLSDQEIRGRYRGMRSLNGGLL